MSEKVKRKYRARIKDVNAPRRPTTAFNFFMKTNSHNYLEDHKDLPLNEVIKIMSVDWHKLTPEERRPFDEAAAAAREEYEKELAKYHKTEAYQNYQKLKSDYKHGLIKPEDIKKATKNSPKKESGPPLKSISKKKFKLGFEVFSETFKEFNRKREEELRKLRKTVNKLEEEVEDAEERIENLQKIKIKMIAEKQESQIIQKRCKETSDRYLKVLIGNMPEKIMEQYGFKKDLTVRQVGNIIADIRQKPAQFQQFKKYVESLKFN